MNNTKVYNANGKVLISSTELIGMTNTYQSGNQIFVSPAIFQLLNDFEDKATANTVAKQLVIKPLSWLVIDQIIESELDKVLK